jgi:DNA transformation protein and related proteins
VSGGRRDGDAEELDLPDHMPVGELPGLGPYSTRLLAKAGIRTLADLRRLGTANAYRAAIRAGAKPNLNLLWAIEGARCGIHWAMVAPARRDQLKRELATDDA